MLECLPRACEALGSIPGTEKNGQFFTYFIEIVVLFL